MPVNLPNFLNAPVQKMVPDIFGEILQGYTMAQEPKRLRDEALQRELANQMAQMQNEFYPQVQQQNLDMGDVNLQSGRLNLDALPKQLQDEELSRSLGLQQAQREGSRDQRFGDQLVQALIQQREAAAKKAARGPDQALEERRRQLINSHQWDSLPATGKEKMMALANGLGIRPDEFVSGMTSGKTFEEIAAERGYNPEDVAKAKSRYLATSGNVRMENERQKNLAELNTIEDKVTDAMAPYISTFAGYSTKQIIDSYKGRNTDDLAKYLAARSLQPEIAALRIKVMGGTVGQGAIEELVKSALGHTKVIQGLVTPDVYKKMNHYVKEWLNEGSQAASESIYGSGSSTPLNLLSDEEFEREALKAGGF